jgi:hypothetical protein
MALRPAGATVVAAALTLTLALVAAALAWSEPRLEDARPLGGEASATGALRIADSRGEAAILRAPALAPSGSVVGSLTIHNLGAAAHLTLSRSHLVETPGSGEGSLAEILRLRIRDLTAGSRALVYHGPLASMPALHLGQLPPGASRRYRFAAFWPELGLVDNSLMGSRVRFDYRWQLRRQ